jgi:hypothetical protein
VVVSIGGATMRFHGWLVAFLATATLGIAPADSQQTVEAKVQSIKDMLVVLCLAGGSETVVSAKGDLELRAKIKDILTGNIGAGAAGGSPIQQKDLGGNYWRHLDGNDFHSESASCGGPQMHGRKRVRFDQQSLSQPIAGFYLEAERHTMCRVDPHFI